MFKIKKIDIDLFLGMGQQLQKDAGILSLLKNDLEQKLNDNKIIFSPDFSELHDYLYFNRTSAARGEINDFIFSNFPESFSLLPGSSIELINNLSKTIPKEKDSFIDQYISSNIQMNNFLDQFQTLKDIDEQEFITFYINAEKKIQDLLFNKISELAKFGKSITSINRLVDILTNGKLQPLESIKEIGEFSSDDKRLISAITSNLNYDKPEKSINNKIDALDLTVAKRINELNRSDIGQIKIYTQAKKLIHICSYEADWGVSEIIRQVDYFKLRTNLQNYYPDVEKCLEVIDCCLDRCIELNSNLLQYTNIVKTLVENTSHAYRIIDKWREYVQECRHWFIYNSDEEGQLEERAETIFDVLKQEKKYVGREQDAIEVFKNYLRDVLFHIGDLIDFSEDEDLIKIKIDINDWLRI
jgi:hypothetical protein